ncbi:unnamed protein product, partial [marine sediment metagenome]
MLYHIHNIYTQYIHVSPVQIYSSKAYKSRYYIKGQFSFLGHKIDKNSPIKVYQLKIVVLIKKQFVKISSVNIKYTPFEYIIGMNIDKLVLDSEIEGHQEFWEPYNKVLWQEGAETDRKYGPIEDFDGIAIEQDNNRYLGILNTAYTEDLMEAGDNVILLKLQLKHFTTLSPNFNKMKKNNGSICDLLLSNYSKDKNQIIMQLEEHENFIDLSYFYEIAHTKPNSKLMKFKEYERILDMINRYAKKWKKERVVSESFLGKLRKLYYEFKPFIDKGKQMKTLL